MAVLVQAVFFMRFFEIPEFKQYAIADGIFKILFASKTWIIPKHSEGTREGPTPTTSRR
jgi:hypothetical protein